MDFKMQKNMVILPKEEVVQSVQEFTGQESFSSTNFSSLCKN